MGNCVYGDADNSVDVEDDLHQGFKIQKTITGIWRETIQ